MKYIITVQKVIEGSMIVEADNLDDAFTYAEEHEDEFEFDEECAYVDTDMMTAKEMD